MAQKYSYDPICEDLAKYFLVTEPNIDSSENARELAQLVQTTVEDFMSFTARDTKSHPPNTDSQP